MKLSTLVLPIWWTFLPSGQAAIPDDCPYYGSYARSRHGPFTNSSNQISYMRPEARCRTLVIPEVEAKIEEMRGKIKNPDLFRIFENTWPNTLDTTVAWMGSSANDSTEELAFVYTGDINAMWLRDSAAQIHPYAPLLSDNTNTTLASLFRGVINLQSRYLTIQPYCQSFQPPPESGITFEPGYGGTDNVVPPFTNETVWECKWEIDSVAHFLMVSSDYFAATGDTAFFGRGNWARAVDSAMAAVESMKTPTYAQNGSLLDSPYRFKGRMNGGAGGLRNDGAGAPVQSGTGLVRSAFRPSDDDCTLQFLVPANAMLAAYLEKTAVIMEGIEGRRETGDYMLRFAQDLRAAIQQHGLVPDTNGTTVYAYEVDGFGGAIAMDDANVPSLLAMPVFGFLDRTDQVYQATRAKVLSRDNPYYSQGPVMSGIGSPHTGTGTVWPIAKIEEILTSNDETEVLGALKELIGGTDGFGLMHESVNSWNGSVWTRQWFSWANGLFGEMVLDLEKRMPEILNMEMQ